MANVNQIYTLLNATSKEALGDSAITVKDTTTFLSLGNQVLSTDKTKESFYDKLADRIGRTYVKYKNYVGNERAIYKTPLEYGMALQKIQVHKVGENSANQSWETASNPFEKSTDDTNFSMQIFAKRGTFAIEKVIYDYQLETAFTSPANMGSFVEMIFADMYNAMELDKENLANLCVATAIASCVAKKATAQLCFRNLWAEYKTTHADAVFATWKENTDFLKFASREINLVTKRMQKMRSHFNTAKADRFTKKEDMVVEILADFATATSSYLESGTYHKELVALPLYGEVDCWQASGTDYDFASTSKVFIKNDDTGINVEQSGIIAFVHDREKCGLSYDRIRTKSIYNPIGERTLYSHKADKGYYVDTSENGVVFAVFEEA